MNDRLTLCALCVVCPWIFCLPIGHFGNAGIEGELLSQGIFIGEYRPGARSGRAHQPLAN